MNLDPAQPPGCPDVSHAHMQCPRIQSTSRSSNTTIINLSCRITRIWINNNTALRKVEECDYNHTLNNNWPEAQVENHSMYPKDNNP